MKFALDEITDGELYICGASVGHAESVNVINIVDCSETTAKILSGYSHPAVSTL